MNEIRTEWVGRTEVAEVAEALGVPSDMIMAVSSEGVVLWTYPHEMDDDGQIWSATLGRDADGIIVVGPKMATGTLGELHTRIDAAMRERFGDPE